MRLGDPGRVARRRGRRAQSARNRCSCPGRHGRLRRGSACGIQHHHVRPGAEDAGDAVLGRSRLPHHLDAAGAEHRRHAGAQRLRVVGEKDLDRLGRTGHAASLAEGTAARHRRRLKPGIGRIRFGLAARPIQVVEDQGAQVGGDAARRGHGAVEHLQHAREFGRDGLRRRLGGVVAQPDRVHLQRRQRLGQLVVQLARDAGLFFLADRMGRGGEGAALLVGAHALGHVAQDGREQPALGGLELGNRGVHRELFAIGTPAVDHRAVAHAPRGHPGLGKASDMFAMAGAKTLGDQPVQRLPQDLLKRPAEDPLRRAVVQHDALLLVHRDDGVHGGVEHARQQRYGAAGVTLESGGIQWVKKRWRHVRLGLPWLAAHGTGPKRCPGPCRGAHHVRADVN